MTKFGMSRKPDYSVSYSGLSSFDSFQNRNRIGATLEDLKIQEVLRHGEILKGAKMEEIHTKSQSHKNRTVRFWIPEYLVFPEQIESV
jgi:hypothetical protein